MKAEARGRITSANFTEAAHTKNIEAGVLIHYQPFVTRLSSYFEALRNSGELAQCQLEAPQGKLKWGKEAAGSRTTDC